MPGAQTLLEPRVGFNLDVNGDSSTLVRGGSGIFTGRSPGVFYLMQLETMVFLQVLLT
jgi:hypothetical protein